MSKPKSRLRVNSGDRSKSGIGVSERFISPLVRPRVVVYLLPPIVRIDEDVLAPGVEMLSCPTSPSSTLVGADDKESAGVAGSDHSLVDVDDKDGHMEEAELVLGA